MHLEELQFVLQGLQETISSLKQYQKQLLLQLEQDLEIAQEELSEKQQAFWGC